MSHSASLAIMLCGGILCFFLRPSAGHGESPSYPGCPSLPEQGLAGRVSVYAVPAQARSGLVCVRVINGLGKMLTYGLPVGRLQKWEEGEKGKLGQFRDYQDVTVLPDGTAVGVILGGLFFPAGEYRDGVLPLSGQPAPTGRYRVCFRYSVVEHGKRSEHEACSEEFSLA
jgi:hypothetical protein